MHTITYAGTYIISVHLFIYFFCYHPILGANPYNKTDTVVPSGWARVYHTIKPDPFTRLIWCNSTVPERHTTTHTHTYYFYIRKYYYCYTHIHIHKYYYYYYYYSIILYTYIVIIKFVFIIYILRVQSSVWAHTLCIVPHKYYSYA